MVEIMLCKGKRPSGHRLHPLLPALLIRSRDASLYALDLLARLRPPLLTTAAPREIFPQADSSKRQKNHLPFLRGVVLLPPVMAKKVTHERAMNMGCEKCAFSLWKGRRKSQAKYGSRSPSRR